MKKRPILFSFLWLLILNGYTYGKEQKTFLYFCKKGATRDSADGVKYTVQRLLWSLGTQNCDKAYKKLNRLPKLDLASDPEGGHQITDIRPIARLPHLKDLDLSHNKIKNLQALHSLTNLRTLNLRANSYSIDLHQIALLSKLQHLDIAWTGHVGLETLVTLKNLRHLRINSSKQLNLISRMTLFTLEISNGQLNDTFLNGISRITSLKRLKIWVGRSRSQSADIDALSSLRHLEVLEFRDAWKLRDISVVAHMKQLNHFSAPFSSISDLSPLADLPHLQTLHLRVNKIPKNRAYCPVDRGADVLRRYCQRVLQ